MRRICILFCTFYLLTAQVSYAQTQQGCRAGGIIYTSPPGGLYGWRGGVSESCPTNASNSAPYASYVQNVAGNPTCRHGLLSLGGLGS